MKKIAVIIASLTVVIFIACGIYVNDYYHAEPEAVQAFAPAKTTEVTKVESGNIVYEPQNATCGLIFYPGGKVEYTAYSPLMAALAEEGVLCVLVEMPFNLAVLDIDAAAGIQEQYPNITTWYIGGHSLGGSMAAAYLEDNGQNFDGLILLGSYSTTDLSETSLDVLSVYGSEDKVLDTEKYESNKVNLPDDFTEVVIDGGCHAYFGIYGSQDGDGEPTITNEEQIRITTNAIVKKIK